MSHPVIVWTAIVVVMSVTLVVRSVWSLRHVRIAGKRRHHFIEVGRESEMFFCPGDSLNEEEDYD